jgi:hypothetical protein
MRASRAACPRDNREAYDSEFGVVATVAAHHYGVRGGAFARFDANIARWLGV